MYLKNRYAFIKSRYSLTDIAHDILLKTVANIINKCTLIELESYDNELNHIFTCKECNNLSHVSEDIQNNQRSLLLIQDTSKQLFDSLDIYAPYLLGYNRFISSETKDVIKSLFSISSPPRELVEEHVKVGIKALKIRRKEAESRKVDREIFEGCERLLTLYKELCQLIFFHLSLQILYGISFPSRLVFLLIQRSVYPFRRVFPL